jgi:hypothetical protein
MELFQAIESKKDFKTCQRLKLCDNKRSFYGTKAAVVRTECAGKTPLGQRIAVALETLQNNGTVVKAAAKANISVSQLYKYMEPHKKAKQVKSTLKEMKTISGMDSEIQSLNRAQSFLVSLPKAHVPIVMGFLNRNAVNAFKE